MKKILILEDNSENIDAAKAFFADVSQQEFIFVYVETVTEAIGHLNDTYFLVADRSVPILKDEIIADYDQDSYGNLASVQTYNGYIIAAIAKSMNIPFIIFSEHGIASVEVLNKINSDTLTTIGQIFKALDLYSQTARSVLSWLKDGSVLSSRGNKVNHLVRETFFKRDNLSTWFNKKNELVTWGNLWNKLLKTNFLKDIGICYEKSALFQVTGFLFLLKIPARKLLHNHYTLSII